MYRFQASMNAKLRGDTPRIVPCAASRFWLVNNNGYLQGRPDLLVGQDMMSGEVTRRLASRRSGARQLYLGSDSRELRQ